MKILVRLPNWLGDMVMSAGAMQVLHRLYPAAEVSVVVKKGLSDLLPFFPAIKQTFIFSKDEFSGLKGVWRFGKMMRRQEKFDLFISFPDSFSSALMGFATGAGARVGYKKEGREVLLTRSFLKPKGLHRVEEYTALLAQYTGKNMPTGPVLLTHDFVKGGHFVININSEASSRRLTKEKAVEVITAVQKNTTRNIVLIGGPNEQAFVEDVLAALPVKGGITSVAGKTTLAELAELLATAKLVLTTDSGPAHLANALGTKTVVLFGAGNENNTSPYNKENLAVIRLGKLSCEPCTKNVCVQFGTPQCLELLDTATIIQAINERLNHEH